MKSDTNWKETRLMAADLDVLLGIPVETSEKFLKVLENLIIHRFLEMVMDSEDIQDGKTYHIELPYLGSLVINMVKQNKFIIDFVVRKSFYQKIKDAIATKESPLVKQLEVELSRNLLKRYEESESLHEQEKDKT